MNLSVVSYSVKSAAFTNCDTIQESRGKGLALPQATLLFFLFNVEMREEMEISGPLCITTYFSGLRESKID